MCFSTQAQVKEDAMTSLLTQMKQTRLTDPSSSSGFPVAVMPDKFSPYDDKSHSPKNASPKILAVKIITT